MGWLGYGRISASVPDLAPALLHSEPGPSVPICEGGTAVCPGGAGTSIAAGRVPAGAFTKKT